MRNLKECYGIVAKNMRRNSGICFSIISCHISGLLTWDEREGLLEHFMLQKPNCFLFFFGTNAKFTKHNSFTGGTYWWTMDESGYEQRVLFLKHLISKL